MSLTTPLLHIVPNGVHGTISGGGHTLRLLLLLLPEGPESPSVGQAAEKLRWPLTQWPSHAHDWLDDFIAAQRSVTLHDERHGNIIASGTIRAAPPAAPNDRRRLDEFWQNALGGAAGLGEMLSAAVTSDAQGCTHIHAAIPAPTLEASLLLPLERARAALETVGGQDRKSVV